MTDQQLSSLGERLYGAIIAAQLSEPALEDLAHAISARRPWTTLTERTKIAVFVVATQMDEPESAASGPLLEEGRIGPPPPVDCADDDIARANDAPPVLGADAPAVGETCDHDAFDDSQGEASGDAGRSIRHEAPEVDTGAATDAIEARAGEAADSASSKAPGDVATEDDETEGQDLDSAPSQVVGKSRRNSSS